MRLRGSKRINFATMKTNKMYKWETKLTQDSDAFKLKDDDVEVLSFTKNPLKMMKTQSIQEGLRDKVFKRA